MTWQPIETWRLRFGARIRYQRRLGNKVVDEGEATWREVTMPPHYDPETGKQFAAALTETGWMHPVNAHRVPVPTHWKPVGAVES